MVASRRRAPADTGWSSLTDTERRIAVLVSEGLTNAQIGARMFMSRHTARVHLRHVFRKLGVNLSTDRYFFTISRDSKNDPREMRVMEDGKMRHACSMPSDPLSA